MSEDAIYMEQRAFEFFRAFPDVPEILRPVYSRFYDVGLIWSDPAIEATIDFPSSLRWTNAGRELREIYDENFPLHSVNFFSRATVLRLLPDGDLGEKARRIFKDDLPKGVRATGSPAAGGGLRFAMAALELQLDDLLSAMKSNRVRLAK